jgi:hypothetical protein
MLQCIVISIYPVTVHIQKLSHILFKRKMKLKANKPRDGFLLPLLPHKLYLYLSSFWKAEI